MANKKQKKSPVKKTSPTVYALYGILALAVIVLVVALIFAMNSSPETEKGEDSVPDPGYSTTPLDEFDETCTYVQMDMQDGGSIVLELYSQIAPITVKNFVKLVSEGFYDGLTFHRIISGFMIQGGDPKGTGYGGSKDTIKGEFAANGVDNPLSHTRGVISMARSNDMDSASSQFFIVHQDSISLDGNYAAFGRVFSGMEVVDAIASVQTGANNRPLTPVVIKRVRVLQEAKTDSTSES